MGGRLDGQRPDTLVRRFYTYGRLLMKRGQLCQPGADYLVESYPMQPLLQRAAGCAAVRRSSSEDFRRIGSGNGVNRFGNSSREENGAGP